MKELLFSITKKDLKLDFFSGTGAGGQHRNKHQNCVRLHHPESGAIATGQSQRDRQSNIREALQNLVKNPKFRIFLARKNFELTAGKTLDQIVDEMMIGKNLKIESKDESGKWVEFKDERGI